MSCMGSVLEFPTVLRVVLWTVLTVATQNPVLDACTRITVEYYRLGSPNPSDVLACTALFEGAVEAGTFNSIHSVPCSTPVFSLCGFRLWWQVGACEPTRGSGVVECEAWLMASRDGDEDRLGRSRARGFPFVRIEPGQYGLVWQRRVPTEAQRQAWLLQSEFYSAQLDAFADPYGGWDLEGGLDDDDVIRASWDDEALDDPSA